MIAAEAFWVNVLVKPGKKACWEWQGSRLKDAGYGRLTHDRKQLYAHRVSWELAFGPLPEDAWVCHTCDNPPCVRPGHLFLCDAGLNAADKADKGRASRYHAGKTHCPAGHPYDDENTYVSHGRRHCRECGRRRHREWLERTRVERLPVTHCIHGHPYDAVNTYVTPAGHRHCRECMRERGRAYKQRKRAARGVR